VPTAIPPPGPLLSIAELHPLLHDLFTADADSPARHTGFWRRACKRTGPAALEGLSLVRHLKPVA
jgi:hypothetical protein